MVKFLFLLYNALLHARFEPAQSNTELATLLRSLQDDEDEVAMVYKKNDDYEVNIGLVGSSILIQ